jgi:hypothetical protein
LRAKSGRSDEAQKQYELDYARDVGAHESYGGARRSDVRVNTRSAKCVTKNRAMRRGVVVQIAEKKL